MIFWFLLNKTINMINRLIPIFAPIFIFFGFEIFFLKPTFIYFIVLFLVVALGASTWKILGKKLITALARWLYLLTPISFLSGGVLFVIFLERPWAKHLLAAAIALFLGIFQRNIFIYIYEHDKYQQNSLENISNYLNLASIFLINSSLFGFFFFLNTPLYVLSLISLTVFFILTFQTIWVNKINIKSAWLHITIICLILFEIFWTVAFLPTAFYVNGLILATSFYLMNNLMRLHLLGNLNKKIIRRYFVLCSLVIILILATAQWS